MRKDKKLRIVAIISLTISVLGLTLGFAAFSNTLTISSSATVSPDASDFKLVFYGVDDAENFDKMGNPITEIVSSVKSEPIVEHKATASNAIIDNEALTIKNMNVTYTEPGDNATYYFRIMNEGKYDAYITKDDFMSFSDSFINKTCVAKEGTTDSLVQEACSSLDVGVLAWDSKNGHNFDSQNFSFNSEYMEISVGEYAELMVYLFYSEPYRADGDFEVIYEDAKLNYSTVKPE